LLKELAELDIKDFAEDGKTIRRLLDRQ